MYVASAIPRGSPDSDDPSDDRYHVCLRMRDLPTVRSPASLVSLRLLSSVFPFNLDFGSAPHESLLARPWRRSPTYFTFVSTPTVLLYNMAGHNIQASFVCVSLR